VKYGFSTLGCPDWQWDDILTAASDLGFDGIELRGVGKEIYLPKIKIFSKENIKAVKSNLKRLNLVVPCLASGAFLFDRSLMDTARREVLDFIQLAGELETPYVRVLADRDPAPGPVDEEAVEENLAALLPAARQAGVTLLAETNGVYADSAKLRTLCERFRPDLGVVWDVHHPYRFFGETAEQTYGNLSKFIKHVHVKDSVITDNTDPPAQKIIYKLTGCGDVPIFKALELLKRDGFAGFVVLEWVKRWNRDLEEPGIVLPHFINAMKNS
jgi:fatty-acyl-CoA synthase